MPTLPLATTRFHELPDGARLRYATFEPQGPVRGTAVVAPGRREFIEKKRAELEPLLAAGFRLIVFEWRGQGLSSRVLSGAKRQRDHILDFATYIADFTSFYTGVVQPDIQGPLLLCGHSMGSHLLLRWLEENPGAPVTAAILIAPMLALSGGFAHTAANFISWGLLKLGHGEDYAPMQHDYDAQDRDFASNPLTHDPVRFRIIEDYFAAWPELTVGGVTWEWLHAALKSMHEVQRHGALERVKTPVLTLTGSEDHVTPPAEIGRYLKLLPQGENLIVPGAMHDLLNEVDGPRAEAWRNIDRFFAKILK